MIYFIRHAEKLDNSVHAKLTNKGLNDSFLYGKDLKLNNIRIDLIISSPIERCIQTAKKISEGYGDIKIEESTLLGNPGIFVNNGDSAIKIFNKYKLVDIINMQLSKQELDGFNEIDVGTKKLLLFMQNQKDNILYISHDAIITPFINCIGNVDNIEENDIVDYLCGYLNSHKHLTKPWN
jgi:broad specificity phosphatase PhoE